MSTKAEELLRLALHLSGSAAGLTLDDVVDEFGCSRRTAQRRLGALERLWPDLEAAYDGEGRKRWRLRRGTLRELAGLRPEELAALDLSIAALRREGQEVEADHLASLRAKVRALLPGAEAARLETDHEALLEAQGLAARPGPRARIDAAIAATVSEAIKACRALEIVYRGRADAEPRRRRVLPYGILAGPRRYLVARVAEAPEGPMRQFRMADIAEAQATAEGFARDPQFNLQAHANRAFGVYQNEHDFGPVAWRFAPEAAAHAREFQFHPGQSQEELPDGSLIVRFEAAGTLEMCWYLYAWGDKVEVLAPPALRALCAGHRRADFPALP